MFKRLQNLHVRADTNSPTTIFGKNEPEVALVNESTRMKNYDRARLRELRNRRGKFLKKLWCCVCGRA